VLRDAGTLRLFVPSDFTASVLKIYNEQFDLPHIYTGAGAYVIGHVNDDQRFKLKRWARRVRRPRRCDYDGISYDREARPRRRAAASGAELLAGPPAPRDALLALLSCTISRINRSCSGTTIRKSRGGPSATR